MSESVFTGLVLVVLLDLAVAVPLDGALVFPPELAFPPLELAAAPLEPDAPLEPAAAPLELAAALLELAAAALEDA